MKEAKELKLLSELISILSNYCGERGDSESAVETLTRIIHERDSCNCIRLKVDTKLGERKKRLLKNHDDAPS